jgi:hypothetical protein
MIMSFLTTIRAWRRDLVQERIARAYDDVPLGVC